MVRIALTVTFGWAAALAAQVAPGALYSQPRPAPGPQFGPIGHGFGNVVFPGTGIPRNNPSLVTGHIPALSDSLRGVPPRSRSAGLGVVPVAVPVFVGGYGYGYAPAATPNVTVINAPQPSPTVVINQNYTPETARPVMRDYTNENLPEPSRAMESYQAPIPSFPEGKSSARSIAADKPTIYLIALEEGTVYPAYAFWVEGDTLHYITTRHNHNRVSLDLVDLALSRQLNQERGLEFKLPGRN